MRRLHSSEAGWKFRSVSGEKNSVQKRKRRRAQQFALESLESRCLLSNIVEYPTPKLSSGLPAQPAEITSAGGNLWFTESSGAIGMVNPSNPSTVVSYPQDLTNATGPQGITVGPDNNIWFTEIGGAIGKLDTSNPSTVIQPYTQGLLAYANPVGITAGPQGDIWFTDAYNNAIGMLNPSSPNTITEIPLPASLVGFTSFSSLITAGPGGKLYFTEANITVGSNGAITVTKSAIGIYDPSAPPASQWSQVSLPSGQEPFGIAVGPDNQSIWYTWEIPTSLGSGPQSSGIGTFNVLAPPSTILPGSIFQLATPSGGVTPQPNQITSGPDGELYLTDTGNGAIYSIDPTSHVISQPNFIGKTVISNPLPYGITTGPDGNLWFTDDGQQAATPTASGAYGQLTISVTAPAPQATQLLVYYQPTAPVPAGSPFSLVIHALTSTNALASSYSGTVTLTLATYPPGAFLGGTTTVTASGGIASFPGLTLNLPGSYVIQATASGLSSISTAITVPAPTPPPAPQIQGATVVTTQKTNKKGKPVGKATLNGYQFTFNMAMNSSTAGNSANYVVQTYVLVNVKVGKRTKKVPKLEQIGFTLKYISSNTVQLLTGKQAFKSGGQITLVATPPTGISSAAGAFLNANDAVHNIAKGGFGITLA